MEFIPAFNPKPERIWERDDFNWRKHAGYWKKQYRVTFEPIQQIYRYQRGMSIFFTAKMRRIDHFKFIGRELKRPCQVKVDAVFYRNAVTERLYLWR